MRRPGLAYPRLQGLIAREAEPPFQALLGAFFILERWGRGPELQIELERALARALQQRLLEDAAELSEALGRLHYQRGDYVQACNAWSQSLELTDDQTRWACLARIGLAQLCFALGDWARGGRVLAYDVAVTRFGFVNEERRQGHITLLRIVARERLRTWIGSRRHPGASSCPA